MRDGGTDVLKKGGALIQESRPDRVQVCTIRGTDKWREACLLQRLKQPSKASSPRQAYGREHIVEGNNALPAIREPKRWINAQENLVIW